MSEILKGLKPQRVFEIFEDICAVPHGSGNTKAISDYCVDFAKQRGLSVYQDSLNNVVIKKAASVGYETHSPVIIQGHLDMVCEKETDCDINMETDGLKLFVDGDLVGAYGTTLGGDDGIAVAMALSVLEDNTLSHPPIEVLFTTDEETGMYGAEGLDVSILSGKRLINIDSEAEGVLTVGCAGGARAEIEIPLQTCDIKMPCYKVSVSGLIGGHSGAEINKGRLNSNVVMGNFLQTINGDYSIIDIQGGLKDNAIPTFTECTVSTNCNIMAFADDFVNNNRIATDSGLCITVEPISKKNSGFTVKTSRVIAEFLSTVPNGVQAMSCHIEGLVETSLNLGILKTKSNALCASFAVRSSVGTEKIKLLEKLSDVAKNFGGKYQSHSHYPAWEYCEISPLRDTFVNVFECIYGRKPVIEAIHAGLECGLFSDKIKGLDAISIGPDMYDIHTPRERLSISSVQRVYEFLCAVLKEL